MKITFAIPAHNEEARIAACLQSVIAEVARTGYDAEIIVINNCSTDRTGEIASSFPRVIVVDEPRKGLTRARQAGHVASHGDLVAHVDADTIMPEGWLTKVVKEFERDPNLVALSGPHISYDLPALHRAGVKVFYAVGYVAYLANKHVFNTGAMLQGGNFVVRRDAMEKIGGFDTSIEFYGEDTDVARRLHPIGNVKWTFALPMYASGRRMKHEGMLKSGCRYALNYVWTTFAKRPWSEEYNDIRTDWRS